VAAELMNGQLLCFPTSFALSRLIDLPCYQTQRGIADPVPEPNGTETRVVRDERGGKSRMHIVHLQDHAVAPAWSTVRSTVALDRNNAGNDQAWMIAKNTDGVRIPAMSMLQVTSSVFGSLPLSLYPIVFL